MDSIPVGRDIETGEDSRTHLLAGNAHLTDFALEHAADRLPVIGNLADIDPFEIHGEGIEGGSEFNQLREEIRPDVKRLTRRNVLEDLWFE